MQHTLAFIWADSFRECTRGSNVYILCTKIAYNLVELCIACSQAEGLRGSSEGLVIVARVCPVTERLADVAVRSFTAAAPVVRGVRRRVWGLHLCRTVLRIVQVEAVTDVAENTWWGFLLLVDLTKT